jgi:type II secretory pathway pseudopilin PulG
MKRTAKHGRSIRRMRGVTLIELVIFIAIAGIVAIALVQAFSATMRGSHYGKSLTQAAQLAQQRLEVIRGQRETLGFAALDATTFDPCDGVGAAWPAQACQNTASYSIASAFNSANDACGAGTGTNCREITLTVTGPEGTVVTRLTYHMWNY